MDCQTGRLLPFMNLTKEFPFCQASLSLQEFCSWSVVFLAAQQTRYNIVEMFIFALIGILCGLLGALFNHMNGLLSRWAMVGCDHTRKSLEMSNNTYKPTIDIHRPYRFRDMA